MLNLKFWALRRREESWEVVENIGVDPVPAYYDEEDFELHDVHPNDVVRTYVFNVKQLRKKQSRGALLFARKNLLEEVQSNKAGFNALLHESWRLTTLRKGQDCRIEVQYRGRPARVSAEYSHERPPPFLDILTMPSHLAPVSRTITRKRMPKSLKMGF